MVDGIGNSPVRLSSFMTGQFRDSAAGQAFLNSLDTEIAEVVASAPAPASAPAAIAAPQSQLNAIPADPRQILAPPVEEVASLSFVPSFRSAFGSDGLRSWGLNPTRFATSETAQWIANKYGVGEVVEVRSGGSGGIFTVSANEYHIKLADGSLVNAGILAGYYQRNPPDQFPGVADKLIRAQLGLG